MPKRITSWVLFFPTPARLPNIRISLSIFPPGSCGCQFFFYQPQPNLPPRLNCPFPKLSKASPLATRQVSCMVKAVGGSGSRSAGELLSAWPARCSPGKAPVSSEEQTGWPTSLPGNLSGCPTGQYPQQEPDFSTTKWPLLLPGLHVQLQPLLTQCAASSRGSLLTAGGKDARAGEAEEA